MTNLSFHHFPVIISPSLFAEGQYALAVGWIVYTKKAMRGHDSVRVFLYIVSDGTVQPRASVPRTPPSRFDQKDGGVMAKMTRASVVPRLCHTWAAYGGMRTLSSAVSGNSSLFISRTTLSPEIR